MNIWNHRNREDDTETFCDQFAGEINKIEDAVREIRSSMK